MGRSREAEPEERSIIGLLTGIGLIMGLIVVSVPLLEALIVNPMLRWGFLMVLLTAGAGVLVWQVYPRGGTGSRSAPLPEAVRKEPRATERELSLMECALQGSPHSQLMSYLELRGMLVRRYMLLHHLTRAEAEAALVDPEVVRSEIGDEDLLWLLSFDLRGAYDPAELKTLEGRRLVSRFDTKFPELLGKLEELR
jgi:hypothetical protein